MHRHTRWQALVLTAHSRSRCSAGWVCRLLHCGTMHATMSASGTPTWSRSPVYVVSLLAGRRAVRCKRACSAGVMARRRQGPTAEAADLHAAYSVRAKAMADRGSFQSCMGCHFSIPSLHVCCVWKEGQVWHVSWHHRGCRECIEGCILNVHSSLVATQCYGEQGCHQTC